MMNDGSAAVHRDLVESVHEFNRLGQVVPPDGTFNADRVCFYTGMQCEELAEKIKHIAEGTLTNDQRQHLAGFAGMLDMLGKEFKRGLHRGSVLRADRESLMDDDIDQLVVSIGSLAYQSGTYRNAIDAVLNANDAKIWADGRYHHDDNGKIVKPEGWVEADISPFVVQPAS